MQNHYGLCFLFVSDYIRLQTPSSCLSHSKCYPGNPGSRINQHEPGKEFTQSLVRMCNRAKIVVRHVGKVETPAALIVTSQEKNQRQISVIKKPPHLCSETACFKKSSILSGRELFLKFPEVMFKIGKVVFDPFCLKKCVFPQTVIGYLSVIINI